MDRLETEWQNTVGINSTSYICGYCRNPIASNIGYATGHRGQRIILCHKCNRPTYISGDKQYPGVPFGSDVSDAVDEDIKNLYDEARFATSVNSYTLTVLACRKLLMHIAVSQGAKEGLSFAQYVDYLDENHFTPPNSKDWVDHIRKKGNEANHEIVMMKKNDAEELLEFIHMILTFLYEYPARIKDRMSDSGP